MHSQSSVATGYSLFLLTLALTIVSVVGELPAQFVNAAVLAGLAFLILWTTGARAADVAGGVSLDTVLRNRDSYGSFSDLLAGATELRMYAPPWRTSPSWTPLKASSSACSASTPASAWWCWTRTGAAGG